MLCSRWPDCEQPTTHAGSDHLPAAAHRRAPAPRDTDNKLSRARKAKDDAQEILIKAGLAKQTDIVNNQDHLLRLKGHLSELPPPRARCTQQALPVEGVVLARGIQMRSTDPVDLPTIGCHANGYSPCDLRKMATEQRNDPGEMHSKQHLLHTVAPQASQN